LPGQQTKYGNTIDDDDIIIINFFITITVRLVSIIIMGRVVPSGGRINALNRLGVTDCHVRAE
jgi:hypothetical protein